MKQKSLLTYIVILVALLPFGYIAIIYNSVPDVIPTHFNGRMEVDQTGSKSSLWMIATMIAAVSILMYLLMTNLHHFDPKRKNTPPSPVFRRFAAGIVFFMTALNFILLISMAKEPGIINKLLFPLLGLMFAFIGNYMNNIKPNYFAGFRLPWTLSDDDNWRRTHHLASKIWFAGGILLAITSLFIPFKSIIYVFVAMTLLMTLIPAIYSYRIFRSKIS